VKKIVSTALSGLTLGVTIALTLDQPNAGSTVYDALAFNALEWRLIGPFRGGRSVAVAGSAARPNEYYHGTTGGGVFKTTNGGLSWFPVTDAYFGGTIGAIAVSDSNPDIVYVGTGERSLRGNLSHGDGMFKINGRRAHVVETTLSQLAPVNDFLRSAGQPAIVPSTDELSLAP
jgi:hypothetical protein